MKKTRLLIAILLIAMLATNIVSCGHTHDFDDWQVVKSATCTESGEKERYCDCGEKQTQSITATGHTWGAWQIIKVTTCTESGEQERYCDCGEKQHQVVSAGHLWSEATCTTPKTCQRCDLIEGSALGHTAQTGFCNRCNTNIIGSMVCTNSFPQTFANCTSYRIWSETQITNVAISQSGNKFIISVSCEFLVNHASDSSYIAYIITDPNGNIVESDYISHYSCVPNLIFTETISFAPAMAGEYKITFKDYKPY